MKILSAAQLVSLVMVLSPMAISEPVPISIYARDNSTTKYAESLIFLAARNTNTEVTITNFVKPIESKAWRNDLTKEKVSIIWSAETEELNLRFKKIPIDIYNGILGYRTCVTHIDNTLKLKSVKIRKDLRSITFGSGDGWRDTEVLIQNGFSVITGSLDDLYGMAFRKEIDCYSRAVFEIYTETLPATFTTSEDLVIHYDNPFYFYVNKSNERLYRMLSEGLEKAIHDGSFIELLQSTKQYQDHVRYMRKDGLKVISLKHGGSFNE